jgi:hypothetical protein
MESGWITARQACEVISQLVINRRFDGSLLISPGSTIQGGLTRKARIICRGFVAYPSPFPSFYRRAIEGADALLSHASLNGRRSMMESSPAST